MMERARLKWLGYESIQESARRALPHEPALLRELNLGKSFAPGDEIVVAAVAEQPAAPAKAASIEIDKSERILFVLGADERVVASFPISIGGPRDPLPVGRMKIVNEVRNPSFTYDPALLKDAKPGTSKTEVAPGPNNPVGNVWLGLSKPHWGIHGTPKPERSAWPRRTAASTSRTGMRSGCRRWPSPASSSRFAHSDARSAVRRVRAALARRSASPAGVAVSPRHGRASPPRDPGRRRHPRRAPRQLRRRPSGSTAMKRSTSPRHAARASSPSTTAHWSSCSRAFQAA
jgi:hypothetical protein